MNRRDAWMMTVLLASCGGALAQAPDVSRAMADELRWDAEARTSMLDQNAPAFAPKISGFILARYNVNYRKDSNLDSSGNKFTTGAQLAYTKLQIGGNVYSDVYGYFFQYKFSESTGGAVLDDAYATMKLEDQWQLKAGQFKPSLLREENIGDTKQLSANRSVMNSVFTQSRTQGIQSTWTGDSTRFTSSFNDGIRTANTDYTSNAEADWGLTGRLEYKWDGDWKQYDEFTSFPNAPYFGAVSGALHYQSASNTVNTPERKIFEYVIDVMVKGNGWNLYGAYVGRSTDTNTTLYDSGLIVQGGYFIRPRWELFGRFDVVIPDVDNVNHNSMDTLTFGANKYISQDSHAVKLTLDFEYFIGKQAAGIAPASTLTGLLASSQYDQWAIQAQLQLMF